MNRIYFNRNTSNRRLQIVYGDIRRARYLTACGKFSPAYNGQTRKTADRQLLREADRVQEILASRGYRLTHTGWLGYAVVRAD